MRKTSQERPHRASSRLEPGRPSVCANCGKTLRPGAKFCTRCGAAGAPPEISLAANVEIPARPAAKPTSFPRTGPKSTNFLQFLVLLGVPGLLFALIYLFRSTRPALPPPAIFQASSSADPQNPESPQLLIPPGAPDPGMPLPARVGPWAGATIQQTWIETGVLDADGVVGLRVHARVFAPGKTGLRFVAHFRTTGGEPVKTDFLQYRDPKGDAAVATTILPSSTATEVTAFIPITIFALPPGDALLKLTPALFDEQSHPIATGVSVGFQFQRGSVYVTMAHADVLNTGGLRLKLSLQTRERSTPFSGQVIVRFKDASGSVLSGRPPLSNAANELMAQADFHIPAGTGLYTAADLTLFAPPGLVPSPTTAEVRLYDPQTHAWISPPLNVPIPF